MEQNLLAWPVKRRSHAKKNRRTRRRRVHRDTSLPAAARRRQRGLLCRCPRCRRILPASRRPAPSGLPRRPPQHRPRIRHPLRRDLQPRLPFTRMLRQGASGRSAAGLHDRDDQHARHGPRRACPRALCLVGRDGRHPSRRCRRMRVRTHPHGGETGSRSPAPRLPRGVRRRHTHRTHLQHLWQRSRPDGSAAGDEERRGGAAQPRHTHQRQRRADPHVLLGRRPGRGARAADGRHAHGGGSHDGVRRRARGLDPRAGREDRRADRQPLAHRTRQGPAGDAPRRVPDLTKARNELGWTPRTPLVEGLRRTIAYAEKELSGKVHTAVTWAEIN